MLDSGNLICSLDNSIIWETFKYPTDTILAPVTSVRLREQLETYIYKKKMNWWVLISEVEIEKAKERSLEEG